MVSAIARIAWLNRRHAFGGGEPEIWFEHICGADGDHAYFRLTFTEDWRSGSYGEVVREPIDQSEVPIEHRHLVEGFPSTPD